jgi:branched-chain amino acid aminotransferase
MQVFVNGSWRDAESAKISVFDRGFLYGDAVFDTIPAYQNNFFRLQEHLQRFYAGADYLGIIPPYAKTELRTLLFASLAKNRLKDALLRLTLSRGIGARGLASQSAQAASLIIYCFPRSIEQQEKLKQGCRVILAQTRKIPSACMNPLIKSANYLNGVLAMREAEYQNADEAFLLNTSGMLAEGACSNIFWIKDRELFTPALSCGIMAGITRAAVVEISIQLGVKVNQVEAPPQALLQAEEVFFTHSGCNIQPVRQVGQQSYACPGEITRKLTSALLSLIAAETAAN